MRIFWKRIIGKKTVLFSMILSYMLAFIIPLIIGFSGSAYFIQLLGNQILETNSMSLRRLKSITDANLENMRSVGQLLLFSQELQSLTYASQPLTSENLVSCWHMQKEMNLQALTNPLIDSIYVTFPSNGTVLSTKGIFKSGDFSSHSQSLIGLDYNEWIGLSKFSGNYKYIMYKDSDDKNSIAVICKPDSQIDKTSGVIVTLLLKGENLCSLLDSLKVIDNSGILIMDEHKNIISSFTYDGIENMDLSNLPNVYQDKETKAIIQQMSSSVNNWVYLSVTPDSIYNRPLVTAKNILIGYITFCLLLGILLLYKIIKKQYTPLKQLTGAFINQLDSGAPNQENEYAVIEKGLSSLLNKVMDNEEKLSEHRKTLRNNALIRIITGKAAGQDSIAKICENYSINLTNSNFIVLLISVDDFGTTIAEKNAEDNTSALDLVHLMIASAFKESMKERYICETTVMDEMVACLVNTSSENLAENSFEEAVRKVDGFIQEKFGITLSIAIGNDYASTIEISKSYQEAVEAMEYMQTMGIVHQILFFRSIDINLNPYADWKQKAEEQRIFLNCIMAEDYSGAYTILTNMVQASFYNSENNLCLIKMNKDSLMSIITVAFSKITPSIDSVFPEGANPIKKLYDAKTIPAFEKELAYIFQQIIAHSKLQKEQEPSKLDDILAYVKKNYTNPDISIASIAGLFSVSVSYVSRCFKSEMGVGLLDFIHTLRIDEAKRLLKNTDLNIKDIAAQVGYYSGLTMTRAFRRYEGVTPSEYRTMKITD